MIKNRTKNWKILFYLQYSSNVKFTQKISFSTLFLKCPLERFDSLFWWLLEKNTTRDGILDGSNETINFKLKSCSKSLHITSIVIQIIFYLKIANFNGKKICKIYCDKFLLWLINCSAIVEMKLFIYHSNPFSTILVP